MREREPGKSSEAVLRDSKAVLRKQVASALARVPLSGRVAASAQACSRLETQRAWREANVILFFAPLATELDIWPLLLHAIAAGKIVSLPRFERETSQYSAARVEDPVADVRPDRFGIREPVSRCPLVPLNRLDFILVPGVAFDLQGRRLGRGKGFYDQLLAAVRGTTCGVAFDEQIVREVPVEPHDVYLNCILTPTRWIEL
jgi:5-formyltetrahydrofolate cyclo-ligase